MAKPSVFIGSSSEGHSIAEAVFTQLDREAAPKLWSHQLFLPGKYPLEVLENELRRNKFAVLIASPDDEVIKRGTSSSAMRDNLLLEFGSFSGVLGRKRTFFICPSSPRVELPSDLFGILTTTYDAARVKTSLDERAAAVQTACGQIRAVIAEEWALIQRAEADKLLRLRATQESQAVQRLNTIATRLRALVAVQRDAFVALFDRRAFEEVKSGATKDVERIAKAFEEDASMIGVKRELEGLKLATNNALRDLPFPQELALGEDSDKQQAMEMVRKGLGVFMSGDDPVNVVKHELLKETNSRCQLGTALW